MIDFPSSPTLDQEYSFSGRVWKYNGTGWSLKVDSVSLTNADVTGALGYTPVNSSALATVATTGSYNDLLDKPTSTDQVNSDWNATSGVEEILNKPTLGTAAATDVEDYATAAQGDLADTAVQPASTDTLTNKFIDSITNQVGADHIHLKVQASEAITKGNVVKVTGYNSGENALRVGKVSSVADVAVGIAHDDIANGAFGAIINTGVLDGINTSAFTVGTILYPNTSGGLTSTAPTSGAYQALAYVIRSQTNNGGILIEASEPNFTRATANTANTLVQRDGSGNFSAGTITAALNGNAATATNVAYSGLTGTVPTWNQNTTGNSATATALQTARTIGGVSFNGTASIDLPGVNIAGNQNTTGTAANVTGTVAVANGGTGQTTYTDGQLLIGNSTGNTLTKATLTAGSNITITNSAGGITIASTASGGASSIDGLSDAASSSSTANMLFGRNTDTTGGSNTSLGHQALASTTSGGNNTAIGTSSLQSNTTGGNNTAIGRLSLQSNTEGLNNTAIGTSSLQSNTTSSFSTAIGADSLKLNTTGANNTAIGASSLSSNTTGSGNTAIGNSSFSAHTGGNNNTAIGRNAGTSLTTGSNNIIIGAFAQPSSATVSDQITLGNTSITSLRCQVTSITSLSDERDKTNWDYDIPGVEFVMDLKPGYFTWNTRDGAKVGIKAAGFGAQSLLATQEKFKADNLDLVDVVNPDKLEARYGHLIPVLVKAIQDQQKQINELKDKLNAH
jgi:hypothetical protein